jgi:TPR repeat protein
LAYTIRVRHDLNPTPSFEDFLHEEDLKMHPWGFLRALNLFPLSLKSTIETLEIAIYKGNHPALLMSLVGYYRQHYERTNDESSKVKCLSLLERAGDLGHPLAYIEMGAFYVRYSQLARSFDFTEVTPSDSEKCKELLEKTRILHFPEASYNFGNHVYQQYRYVRDTVSASSQVFLSQAIEYYKEAAREGFWPVYGILKQTQNLLLVRTWEFDSPRGHHSFLGFDRFL